MGDIMKKLFLPLALLLLPLATLADDYTGISVIKPLFGKHFKERNFTRSYNENYLDSIGVGYRHESGLGAYAIYVNENSVNNSGWYIHGEYMAEVYSNDNINLSVGGALGVRNGYGKKAINRKDSDFIESGALQFEGCYSSHCALLMVAPITNGVAILNYKYRF